MGDNETAQDHGQRNAGNRDTVRLTVAKFFGSTLIHIAHGAAQRVTLLVHQHHALHL